MIRFLLRPDGYTAWIAPSGTEELSGPVRGALATWFGSERRFSPAQGATHKAQRGIGR